MNTSELNEENPVSGQPTHSRQRILSACGLALTALVVSACGGGSSGSSAGSAGSSPSSSPSSAPSSGAGPAFRGSFTGAAGKVVSINSAGAKLQSTSGTATIAWASTTRFSKVSTISLSSLATGDCVTVATTSSSPTTASSTLTARSVTVTATSGCSQQFGRVGGGTTGGGPLGGGFGSAAPFGSGGSPRPRPSGSPGTGRGFGGSPGRGFGTFGTVASVSGSAFVVKPLVGTGKVTVKTDSTTTFSSTSVVTSSTLVTGVCASAIGSKTSGGTVDALSITISAPSNGKCTVVGGFGGIGGFGGFGGGRPGSGSANPGAASA